MNHFENILKYFSDLAVHISHIMIRKKQSKVRRALSTGLACVIVFVTTYSLILPAITLENSAATDMPGVFLEDNSDSFEADYYDDRAVPSADEGDETWFENGRRQRTGMKKERSYIDSIHHLGRVWNLSVMVILLLFPVAVALIFGAGIDWRGFAFGMLATAPMFWAVGIIETITYHDDCIACCLNLRNVFQFIFLM